MEVRATMVTLVIDEQSESQLRQMAADLEMEVEEVGAILLHSALLAHS
jgi:hypothetical protein